MDKKRTYLILIIAVLCCGVMAFVDGIWQPQYALKSFIKICLFLSMPFFVTRFDKGLAFRELFRFSPKGLLIALGLGLGVYAVILGAYFILRGVIDFSGIAGNLIRNAGVHAGNFLWVSLYISFANSFLEEFFFRGFLFTNLKKSASQKNAYWFSSVLFSLYHVAMMTGWFSPFITLLPLIGLVIGGMIFNYLNEKTGTVYASWLVHMFANFAINTVGFILLGIL